MTALIENSLLSADVQSGHSEEDHLSAELMKFLLENWRIEMKSWREEARQFQKLLLLGRCFQQDPRRKIAMHQQQKKMVEEEFPALYGAINDLVALRESGSQKAADDRPWQETCEKYTDVRDRFTAMRLEMLRELSHTYPVQLR